MGWTNYLLLGDLGQQLDINEMQEHVERLRNERDLVHWDIRKIREVADELLELQIRHGMLVRLLIAKSVISAEEYAKLIAASKSTLKTQNKNPTTDSPEIGERETLTKCLKERCSDSSCSALTKAKKSRDGPRPEVR